MAVKNDRTILERKFDRSHSQQASHMCKNEYFEIYAAKHILKDFRLSDKQLCEGNVGGAGDGGIDGAYLFANCKWVDETNKEDFIKQKTGINIDLYIIQAKNSNKLEVAVIEKFSSTVDDLLNPDKNMDEFEDVYNSDILRIFKLFREITSTLEFPEISIKFYYVTKGGNPSKDLKHRRKQLCDSVEQFIDGYKCDFRFIGAAELLELTRRTPPETLSLEIADGPIPSVSSENYVALIRLHDYYQFITDQNGSLRERLFEANVRDWQGKNKVNVQIQTSLETNPVKDFWWLNNGVTILATRVGLKVGRVGGKTLQLENPEIINGLQTTRTIHQYFSDSTRNSQDNRKILVRTIVVSDEDEGKSREQIIKATNSQTSVPAEALRSLDRVHYNIEEYFKTQEPPLYYDRRRNFYKNQGKPANKIISIKKLAQSVIASLLFKPDDARGRPTDYLRAGDDEKYLSIFNEEYPHELYYACAEFYQRIDKTLKSEGIHEQFEASQRRLVRFYIMTHVILRHLNISRIHKPLPVYLITRKTITAIDENLNIASANRILKLRSDLRNNSQRLRWAEFQNKFFEDLDSLLPQNKSP